MAARSITCLAVLLALFEIGSCLRCYQCNTQSDKNCADTFNSGSQSVDCSDPNTLKYNQEYLYPVLPAEIFGSPLGAPKYCHKIVMASGTVIRTCLDAKKPTDPINHTCEVMIRNSEVSTPDKKISKCFVCDKDNCNGAGSLTYSLPLAFVAIIASFLLCKQ